MWSWQRTIIVNRVGILQLRCFAAAQKMEGIYGKLCKKYPDMAKQSEKKLEEVHDNWNRLEDLANVR